MCIYINRKHQGDKKKNKSEMKWEHLSCMSGHTLTNADHNMCNIHQTIEVFHTVHWYVFQVMLCNMYYLYTQQLERKNLF